MVDEKETASWVAKVPEATLVFWIIKILCTTIGETGGDAFTMSFLGETTSEANPNGYLIGTCVFAVIFFIAVAMQIKANKFHPFLYWFTIIATTTVGTTLADYLTRANGLGYTFGSALLLACVIACLVVWKLSTGTIDIASVRSAKTEMFYWLTIMFSQTLGTALGDWFADTADLGYLGAAGVFGAGLLVLAVIYYLTKASRPILFWIAFILTRPLGAVVGDFLDKPHAQGGLALSRYVATAILLVLIIGAILIFPQRPAQEAH
ncbi:MAG TPA: hypothetical protein VJT50_08650 [Pyrinomonadaceae bacterium]|nr:hypothetical protein [Pyrinomonadaceae bacterium]